jgi:plasmid stabilization system protein ParE
MNLNVVFEIEAEVELFKIQDYLRGISPELARQFNTTFQERLMNILEFPEAFSEVMPNIRRALILKQPYFIFYSIDPDAIFIYAIAHQKRDPHYWLHRVKPN